MAPRAELTACRSTAGAYRRLHVDGSLRSLCTTGRRNADNGSLVSGSLSHIRCTARTLMIKRNLWKALRDEVPAATGTDEPSSTPSDARLLLEQWRRHRGAPPVHPSMLDEVTLVSTIGRRRK